MDNTKADYVIETNNYYIYNGTSESNVIRLTLTDEEMLNYHCINMDLYTRMLNARMKILQNKLEQKHIKLQRTV